VAIDLYRVVSVLLNPGKYQRAVLDLLFWLACALVAFQYLLANSASARLYMLFGLAVGLIAEQLSIGPYVRRFARTTLRLCVRVLQTAVAALVFFTDAILGVFVVPVLFVARGVRAAVRVIVRFALLCRNIFKNSREVRNASEE